MIETPQITSSTPSLLSMTMMTMSPPPPPPPSAPVPAPPAPPPPPDPNGWTKLLDKKENGAVDSTLWNATIYLRHHPDFAGTIRWNSYAKQIEVHSGIFAHLNDSPKSLVTEIQNYLAHQHRISIGSRNDLSLRILLIAEENAYNPLRDYLMSLGWDGTERNRDIFTRYFGAGQFANPNTPTKEELATLEHYRLIGPRWLLGAVERAFRPGCKVDNSIILVGVQGARKTSALEALFGKFYSSTEMTVGDKDSKMIAAKNWAVDLPDSDFITSKRNKGFLTTRVDSFRPPFGEAVQDSKRTCFFIGSQNDEQTLDDETGNRRPWHVRCGEIDRVALLRDHDQLLAEAVYRCMESQHCPDCLASTDTVFDQLPRCKKHRWWLDKEEEKAAATETLIYEKDVPFKLRIHEWWLNMPPEKRPEHFSVEDVAAAVLNITEDRLTIQLSTLIGLAVRKIGFLKSRPMINGIRHYAYIPSPALAIAQKVEKPKRALFALTGGKSVK